MSQLLTALRGDQTQTEAASRAGLTQAKVSRAENGRFPLSPAEADGYARALGATTGQRRRLTQLAEVFADTNVTTRAALTRSARAIQQRVGQLERDSTLIRSWQPEIVPGILQTPAYTAAVIRIGPGLEWLAARAERRAHLADPGRIWHQLVSEGALRWPLGSRELMAEQIDHLIAVSRQPNVRLGIIDQASVKPIAPPAAFHLFGRRVASVATETATAFLTDPHDVGHYEARFDDLLKLAMFDSDARTLLGKVRDDYNG